MVFDAASNFTPFSPCHGRTWTHRFNFWIHFPNWGGFQQKTVPIWGNLGLGFRVTIGLGEKENGPIRQIWQNCPLRFENGSLRANGQTMPWCQLAFQSAAKWAVFGRTPHGGKRPLQKGQLWEAYVLWVSCVFKQYWVMFSHALFMTLHIPFGTQEPRATTTEGKINPKCHAKTIYVM